MPDSNLMDRSHRTGGSANKELDPDGGNGQDLSWAAYRKGVSQTVPTKVPTGSEDIGGNDLGCCRGFCLSENTIIKDSSKERSITKAGERILEII